MMSCGGFLEPQTTSETPGYVLKSVDSGIFVTILMASRSREPRQAGSCQCAERQDRTVRKYFQQRD